MQFFREERMRCVRLFAGNRYNPNAANKRTYVNLIGLYINIMMRALYSSNPRVMLSTYDNAQRPAIDAAEMWMNEETIRQDFASPLRRTIMDGLIQVGWLKCCLATPGDALTYGWGLQAGAPFMMNVDPEDIVYDHRAKDFGCVQFMGNRYRAPLEWVKNFEYFNKKARDRVEISKDISYNRQGDERIAEIGRNFHGYDEDLYDMVELWEIYLPQERVVKTFTESDLSGPTSHWNDRKPLCLREQEWIGPDHGPFIPLAYQIVPGNIHPKGPVQDLIDLHEVANEGYRKLVRQFARQKRIITCQSQNPADGEAARTAPDGSVLPLTDPKTVSEITLGGGDAGLFAWTRDVIDQFMKFGGNLLTMGGLAPQARTLGQEELLATQSNAQVASMQEITSTFVSKAYSSMFWYYWHDPSLNMKVALSDPELPDARYTREIGPWNDTTPDKLNRAGPLPNVKIVPFSMQQTSPQKRVQDIMSIVQGLYAPLAQVFAAQGVVLDINQLLGILSRYMDVPELQSILTMQQPQESPEMNSTGSAPTERVYTHQSVGNESKAAQDMEMDNSLSSQMSGESMNGAMSGAY